MPPAPDYIDCFVAHLRRLQATDDRAALARLRRGLGKDPGTTVETHAIVQPWLPRGLPPWHEDACYLIASLFAAHPEPGGRGSLGEAFRRLAEAKGGDSTEKRFVALLNCHGEELATHLRHAVSLLASGGVLIDWPRLLGDVQGWGHPARRVQRDWSRDFWAPAAPADDAELPDY
jgi:CRISPR system Cascade subunit CasB